ncbi:beta-ketoacyl synthase N-terminal-like domain-containing protein [Embleya sp. AB8]|uniref:beta-ketoacyl synthase N-terminal-like domain-containing protein n=1 Tax=Embleya sp. AB8 TaxID=3156304 RepID=UPI003C736985
MRAGPSRAGSPEPQEPVAVVGMGVVAPGASSPQELWEVLRQPEPQHRPPCRFDPKPLYSPDPEAPDRTFGVNGGYIDAFRPHPRLAGEIDQGRWERGDNEAMWLRHTLLQATEHWTPGPADRAGCYVATWVGASSAVEDTVLTAVLPPHLAARQARAPQELGSLEHRWHTLLRHRYPYASSRPRMTLPDMLVHRATEGLLPEHTDWLTVSAACASSLYAVDLGIHSLLADDCEVAFCGSVSGMGRLMAISAAKFQGMSRAGDIRAFDAAADGTLFGEGATMLVLKRLERAEADGDRILGLVTGSGVATDGRGKSMSAPNPAGLRRALARAWESAGVTGRDIDWILAHGTGTLAGDQVEIEVLSEAAPDTGFLCTANKSLLGHAAWSAGGLSMVHALLALEHGQIPAQQRFSTPHPALAGSGLRVPTVPVPWPARPGRPRRVDVGGLGVGGANAHILVEEAPAPGSRPSRHRPVNGVSAPGTPVGGDSGADGNGVVLVAWSAWLPGDPGQEQIARWLAGQGEAPERSFGADYPASAFAATRLPPVVVRDIDRTHRMVLDVAHRFVTDHGELWKDHRDRTGVITAHTGPTRTWLDATVRACSPDLAEALPVTGADREALAGYLAHIKERQAISEETLAGGVPSLAAYRVTNRWDLHGAGMGIDAGPGSAHAALHAARRYLTRGILDLALVIAMNEGSSPESALFTERPADQLSEGAFLLALTRASLAREQGWPILAALDTSVSRAPAGADGQALPEGSEYDYLGAQGAVDLLRAVESGTARELRCPTPALRLRVTPKFADEPAPPLDDAPDQPRTQRAERGSVLLRRADAAPGEQQMEALPDGAAVLVNSAEAAAELAPVVAKANGVLFSTDPRTARHLATVVSALPDEAAATPLLEALDRRPPHLRIIATIHHGPEQWPTEDTTLTRLLELTLLSLKRYGERLVESTGSVAVLIRDPLPDFQVHPETAQFTGFLRALGWEIPPERTRAVVTDALLGTALAELAAECAARPTAPVAYYRNGLRHTEQLCRLPLPLLPAGEPVPGLGPDPVVVAAGGAHGVAFVALAELARRHRPELWLLGRTDPAAAPPEILAAAENDQGPLRARFIAHGRAVSRGTSVAELNRRFERHWRARTVAANLATLRTLCGEDRVHYVPCDITDPEATARAATRVLAGAPHVDLLVHAAFHQESARYPAKSLAAFRTVRATKITGFRNLRTAFAERPPRLWCSFGSSIVLFGLAGETDYAAGSEFLAAAARYESRLLNRAAITIGWGLWEEAGSVAGPEARERLARTGVVSGVTDAEGAAFFLAELAHPRTGEPAPVYTTAEDRALAARRAPGLTAAPSPAAEPRPGRGLLGEPDHRTDGEVRWTWRLDPLADAYLLEHLIDGEPALPGMYMVAMAAEAARLLNGGEQVTGLRDVRFEEFVRADPRRPGPTKYRITACSLTSAGDPSAPAPRRVLVRVLSDVTARDGRLLRRDREHARLTVLTAAQMPTGPVWEGKVPAPDSTSHTDPCCHSGGRVHLTGVFRNCTDIATAAGQDLAWCRCHPVLSPHDILARAPLPVLLLDSLGRTSCFPVSGEGDLVVQAPLGIARIDLYVAGSDSELAAAHPSGFTLYGEPAASRYTAVGADGRVAARITGLERHPFGRLPRVPLPRPAPSQ